MARYVRFATPKWEEPRHLQRLCDAFDRAQRGEPVRVCVSVPPRHAKTETEMHGLVRRLDFRPDHFVCYATYGRGLARKKSWEARRIARRVGVALAEDSKAVQQWHTPEGGGFLATSVGAEITGQGLNLVLVDDPHKSREEAESPAMREKVWSWFTSDVMTRLEPNGAAIVSHARWNDDDLIGRLAKTGEWEIINLPAIIEGADGERCALWPWRYDLEALDRIKRTVGPYAWHSLYMGEPRPREAVLFGDPARFSLAELPKIGVRVRLFCDPAASDKTSADYSVILAAGFIGYGEAMRMFVLDVQRGHWEAAELVTRLLDAQAKWASSITIETVAGFKMLVSMLRAVDRSRAQRADSDADNGRLRIVETTPKGDKWQRAQPVSAAWKDGRVLVPLGVPWASDFIAEHSVFTGISDAHDDQVDATSMAWNAEITKGDDRRVVEIATKVRPASRWAGVAGRGY